MFRRRTRPSEIVIRPDQQLPPSEQLLLPSNDGWMSDTETLTREDTMTTEPQTETERRHLDGTPDGGYTEDDLRTQADEQPAPPVDYRDACPHCRGTGKTLTTNDLLRESIGLLGDGGDEVMQAFYGNLLYAAPYLTPLFPADLTDPLSAGPGRAQRDKLLGALVAVSQTYDPDRPDQMAILDRHLESFGRAHNAFDRGNGKTQGATLAEYNAVKVVLFNTLHDVAGAAWRPEYDEVWSEAYDYAAGAMLFHGMRSGFRSARYARP